MGNPLDPLGRNPNEPLDPERHTLDDLLQRQRSHPKAFNALWQQNPRPVDGNHINPAWFPIVGIDRVPQPSHLRFARAWDIAYTKKELSKRDPDFTVGVKGALHGRGDTSVLYILNIKRWQDVWPVTKRRILSTCREDGLRTHVIVEGGGSQSALVDELRASKSTGSRIYGLTPLADKLARAQGWIDMAEQGRVILIEAFWNTNFLNEAGLFDKGKHDDQIDAISLLYEHFRDIIHNRNSVSILKSKGLYK